MIMSAISNHAERAGRLHVNAPIPYATVSPLAGPGAFASKNRLRIQFIAREEVSDGMGVVVLFTNRKNQGAVVAGNISLAHDDHDATILEDLDFLPMDEANEELHIALDVVLGERSSRYRRQLLRSVA